MLDMCSSELTLLDLKINSSKSCALRIGNRFKSPCRKLEVNDESLVWADRAKYLGIYIENGAKFKSSFKETKSKFYRSANGILCKLGTCDSTSVKVSLMTSIALPTLLYGMEALSLNNADLNLLDHPWTRTFEKIFKTFDKNVVKQCQFYTGSLSFHKYYSLRVISFLLGCAASDNILIKLLSQQSASEDVYRVASRYGCTSDSFMLDYRNIIINAE